VDGIRRFPRGILGGESESIVRKVRVDGIRRSFSGNSREPDPFPSHTRTRRNTRLGGIAVAGEVDSPPGSDRRHGFNKNTHCTTRESRPRRVLKAYVYSIRDQ